MSVSELLVAEFDPWITPELADYLLSIGKTYEQVEAFIGFGSYALVTNLAPNPKPTTMLDYGDIGYYVNPVDGVKPDVVIDTDGEPALKFTTDAAPGQQGVRNMGLTPVVFEAGVHYRFALDVRADALVGATLFFGATSAEPGPLSNIAVTPDYQRFELVWTPTADRTNVRFGLRSPSAGAAATYYMRKLVVTTDENSEWFDPDSDRDAAWVGAPNASGSKRLVFTPGEDEDHVPWEGLLDVDTVPYFALPYLAQFVGEDLPSRLETTDEALAREVIKDQPNSRRGTVASIVATAQHTLTGNRTVILIQRDPDADSIIVNTLISETPDPGVVCRSLRAKTVPADIEMAYAAIAGQTWATLTATEATWADVLAGYDTWAEVVSDLPGSGVYTRRRP